MNVKMLKNLVGTSKIFTVVFEKKDKTLRSLNGRLGVQKNLKGQGLAYNAIEKNLLVCYDMRLQAYRTINASTIKSISCGGVKMEIKH